MTPPLTRIAVVDAGEPALNLIGAVREYRGEHACDLRVVAMHTHDDAGSMWVREADEAVLVATDDWSDMVTIERALIGSCCGCRMGWCRHGGCAPYARRFMRTPRYPTRRGGVGSAGAG